MAWDFRAKLDWMDRFVRQEVEPLGDLSYELVEAIAKLFINSDVPRARPGLARTSCKLHQQFDLG